MGYAVIRCGPARATSNARITSVGAREIINRAQEAIDGRSAHVRGAHDGRSQVFRSILTQIRRLQAWLIHQSPLPMRRDNR